MRTTLLLSATLLALSPAAFAQSTADDSSHWAHQPGTGMSGPASATASNIGSGDTRSSIAPHLPTPASGDDSTAEDYLKEADSALAAHKTGAAQQALEMAETRMLTRSTPVSAAGAPDSNPEITALGNARTALGQNNIPAARAAIRMALQNSPG